MPRATKVTTLRLGTDIESELAKRHSRDVRRSLRRDPKATA
jgi:hypothetical protein